MYKCPGCGAALRFDPKSQMLLCDHCRTTLSPKSEELTHLIQSVGQNAVGEVPGQDGKIQTIVYTCPNCGGTILSTDATAATFCNYCDASVLLEGRLELEEAPDVIIPFHMDKEDCKAAYKRLLGKALFAPSYLKRDEEIEKFRGIYMPYWIYSFFAEGPTHGDGQTSYRSGNYIITEHYRVHRNIRSVYDGLSYDASSDFSDVLSEAISPFRSMEAEPFRPSYMSGFYADVSDVDQDVYEPDAEAIVRDYMSGETVSHHAYSSHGVSASSVSPSIPVASMPKRKGYFPVWFLANRVPGRDRIVYAIVNGETGKIAADLPVAFWKYVLAAVLLSVPLFFMLNAWLTLTPSAALIATIVISAIMLFVLNHRFTKTFERQSGVDKGVANKLSKQQPPPVAADSLEEAKAKVKAEEKKNTGKGCLTAIFWVLFGIGLFLLFGFLSDRGVNGQLALYIVAGIAIVVAVIYWSITGAREKKKKAGLPTAPVSSRMKYLIKPIIGIVAAVLVLIIKPVSDVWYYGAAVLSELLVIWCAFDAVSLHNRGTTRPLPQFNKRGGYGK